MWDEFVPKWSSRLSWFWLIHHLHLLHSCYGQLSSLMEDDCPPYFPTLKPFTFKLCLQILLFWWIYNCSCPTYYTTHILKYSSKQKAMLWIENRKQCCGYGDYESWHLFGIYHMLFGFLCTLTDISFLYACHSMQSL